MVRSSDERGGAGGSHGNGGLVGLDVNDALDGDFIRLELLDDVHQMRADGGERGGLDDGLRDGNHVKGEHGGLARIAFEHGVTGVPNGWVDGEDTHEWKL